MITLHEALLFSRFIFGLFFLWLLYWIFYRRYLLECFRQEVFEVRDCLFDRAAKIDGGFSDPGYVQLRETLNGCIRYADRVGPVSMALASLFFRDEPQLTFTGESKEMQQELDEANRKLGMKSLRYLFLQRPFFGWPVLIAIVLAIVLKQRQMLRQMLSQARLSQTRPIRVFEAEALKYRGDSVVA